jgi:phosphate-selective porin OprO/OprP
VGWGFTGIVTTVALLIGFMGASPARATDPAMAELLKILRERGSLSEAEYEALSSSVEETPEAAPSETESDSASEAPQTPPPAVPAEAAAVPAADPGRAEVKLGDKGLEIETPDGKFALSVGGRLQFDAVVSSWGENGKPESHLNDGIGVRRGRIHTEGTLYSDWDFKFEYDFVRGSGTTAAGITDAWIEYTNFKPFTVTVGQFKEPFSLESVTSNRYITFIERSMANNAFVEFANPYLLGTSIQSYGQRWTARAAFQAEPIGNGGYNANTSLNGQGNANRNGVSGNPTIGATARATFLPIYESSAELLHLGLSGSFRSVNNTSNGAASMRFASQVESVDRSNYADTGNLTNATRQLSEFYRVNAELAGIYNSFSFATEFIGTQLNGKGYTSRDFLYGYYAYVSYFLTGESRAYNSKAGKFDRQAPKHDFSLSSGGWGAWEIATRFEGLDMNSGHVSGGHLQMTTTALNWYLNPHLRLMANYSHVISNHVDTQNLGTNSSSASLLNSKGQHPNIFNLRAQIDW